MVEVIDYNPPRTLKAFMRDHREGAMFYTWIIGPVGSGKTTGLFFKLVHMARMQKKGPDGIRRTRAVVVRNCFDDQTEILTERRGWRLFRDLVEDDRVAMLDGDRTVFVTPTMRYQAPYKGQMIGIAKQNLDFLATPDHNMWTAVVNGCTKARGPFRHEKAEEAYGLTNRQFQMTAAPIDGDARGCSVAEFGFLGLWFAEGSAGSYEIKGRVHRRLNVTQTKHIDYVRQVLRRAGLSWGESKKLDGGILFTIHFDEAGERWFKELLPTGEQLARTVPAWMKTAPLAHLQAFLQAFDVGSGHTRQGPNDTTRLYTASKQLADDLQEMVFYAGGAAVVRKGASAGRQKFPGERVCYAGGSYTVTVLAKCRSAPQPQKKEDWFKVDYDGVVYCVEVPTHVVYVRRNGIPMWCGQTASQLKDTTIVSWNYWFKDGQAGKWFATDRRFLLKFGDVECEVLFRPLDTEDDVQRVLSLEVTFAIIDEFTQLPKKIIDALAARCGRYPPAKEGGATNWGMWGSSNPDTEDVWWYEYLHGDQVLAIPFEKAGDPEVVQTLRKSCAAQGKSVPSAIYLKQPSGYSAEAENVENLPGKRGYYAQQAEGKSEAWVKQFIESEWGFSISGKPVISTFDPERHVSKKRLEYNPRLPLVFGLDPGLGGSAVVFGQLGLNGRLYVLGELVQVGYGAKRLIADRILPYIHAHFPQAFDDDGPGIVCAPDPASAGRGQRDEIPIVNEFKRVFSVSIEANNRLPLRVDAYDHFFARSIELGPAVLIDLHECQMLVRALRGGWRYEMDPKRDNVTRGHDPEKNQYSHPADAGGYLFRYFHRRGEADKRWGSNSSFTPPKTFGGVYNLT